MLQLHFLCISEQTIQVKRLACHKYGKVICHFLFLDRDQFQLGSLSHIINARATGYLELPDFPEVAPDPAVRVVEVSSLLLGIVVIFSGF